MLPDQESATNPTASAISSAYPHFDGFLSGDNSAKTDQTTPDTIKIEKDTMTNQGYQAIEQQWRREAQQQNYNMARPGPPRINLNYQIDETGINALQAALAADNTGAPSFQLETKAEIGCPSTPTHQFINCKSRSFQSLTHSLADQIAGQFPITPDSSPFTTADEPHAMERSRTFDATPIKSVLHPDSVSSYITSPEAMRRSWSYPDNKSCLDSLFPDLSTWNVDFATKATDQYDSSNYSPMSSALTPLMSSFESSPEMNGISLFDNVGNLTDFLLPPNKGELPSSQTTPSLSAYPSPPKEASHRRTQSVVTVDSIDGINEETGITEDEISAYIEGPHQDSKYICTYEGCNKLFGRKENIRSHIQTHLGDRQWRCSHCHKRFVRQHDLKRHAKIHTGQKPHQCPCGNGFARQDALTRHRQRNTCIGGFGVAEGIPQSPSKRGRPKKRPDLETRRDKASKTRERVLEKVTTSSVSGSSTYSAPSPEALFGELTTNGMKDAGSMVTIPSVEGDEVLEAINALTPEMVEEYFNNMSKDSSPFSEFEAEKLFGANNNEFDLEPAYDCTSQWGH